MSHLGDNLAQGVSSTRTSAELSSHGRGGAGNISRENIAYGDGEITRQGDEGAYGGRGGAGNMSPQAKASSGGDIVPEMAIKQSDELPRHAGRGGAGNVDPGKPTYTTPVGLADKLKFKIMGKK